MLINLASPTRRLWTAPVLLAAALLLLPQISTHSRAQGAYRLIVMGEDSDPTTISRKNDIYKRVIDEIRRPMKQNGFDVLDEDIVAADLGFVFRTGMEKREVVQAVMLANRSKNVNNRVRFLSLMRIHVFAEPLSFTKQVHVRLDGELYDMNTNLFIESFEIPEATFPAPVDCNDICLTEKGGAYARDMAANLGAVLTRQLAIYLEKNQAAAIPAIPAAASEVVPSSYTMIVKNFKVAEATQFVQGLRNDNPETVTLDLIESDNAMRRYQFVTRAKNEAILDTLHRLLGDLNLSEKDVNLAITNQTISIEKLRY